MSGHSQRKQKHAPRYHCRHCNHKLESAKQRCPACKRGQESAGEAIALALMIAILGVMLYLLVSEEDKFGRVEEEQALKHIELNYGDTTETVPVPSVFQPLTSKPAPQSALQSAMPPQPKRPKAAPLSNYQGTAFKQRQEEFPYYVAEKQWNSKKKRYDFYRTGMQGTEVPMRGDARRYFISENQGDYPEPESGCGPTALLNLYVWYSKFGLLEESIRHADPQRYKQLKFKQIDRKLLEIQQQSRSRNEGTNTLAAIVSMDELLQQYSSRPTRLHFEVKQPPLSLKDFTELSRNYRAGILSVRPKDKNTGKLLGNHAVLCIRGDTSGMITIANWGKFSHGRLITKNGSQWFIPRDSSQHELKISNLTMLVPFTPKSGT